MALVGALHFDEVLDLEPLASQSLPIEVVLCTGEHDFIKRAADEFVDRVRTARKTVIDGAGHAVQLDAPAEFNRILRRAIAAALAQ